MAVVGLVALTAQVRFAFLCSLLPIPFKRPSVSVAFEHCSLIRYLALTAQAHFRPFRWPDVNLVRDGFRSTFALRCCTKFRVHECDLANPAF